MPSQVDERDLPRFVRQRHHHGDLFKVGILEQDLVKEVAGLGVVHEQRVLRLLVSARNEELEAEGRFIHQTNIIRSLSQIERRLIS